MLVYQSVEFLHVGVIMQKGGSWKSFKNYLLVPAFSNSNDNCYLLTYHHVFLKMEFPLPDHQIRNLSLVGFFFTCA